MKQIFRLSGIMAMVLTMAFAALGTATAQTSTEATAEASPVADPVAELNKIDTDVVIYGRTYQADMSGTQPSMDEAMPVTAIVQAYVVDDADAAEEAFPFVQQLMTDELESVINAEFETEDVADLGNKASLSTAEVTQGSATVNVALYLVQDEEIIYLSASVVANGPADDVANDFLTFMMDAEPGDADAVEFMEPGTSTGGYFDTMPTVDDAADFYNLIPTEDMYESGSN